MQQVGGRGHSRVLRAPGVSEFGWSSNGAEMSLTTGRDGSPKPASGRDGLDFAALVDAIPALILICDAGGACIFANARVREATGLPAEAWLGDGWIAAIHPDDRVRVAAAWGRAITASQPFELEYRIRTASGGHGWHLVRATPLRDGDRIAFWIGHATDIDHRTQEVEMKAAELAAAAERKEAERRQAEEFAARVIDANADLIQTLSLDGRLLTINTAGAAARTMDLEDLVLGRSWIGRWPTAEGRAMAGNAVGDAARGGIGRFTAPYVSASGERRWWNVAITPMRDGQGEVQSLLCVARDVTEGAEALERLELITSTVREGFYQFDWEKWQLLYASSGYEAIWGLPAKVFQENVAAYRRCIHPEDYDTVAEAWARLGVDESRRIEYRIIHPDGQVRWVRDLAYPIQDDHGRVTQVVGSIEDITEAVQATERLRLIAETVQEGFYQTDLRTGLSLYSSPGCDRILGRSTRILEREPQTYLDWVHPEDRTLVRAAMERERQGEPCRLVYRIVRPDGEIRWLRDLNHPVFGARGIAEQTVGTIEDITEIKAAEARAEAASQERYRSIFDLAAVGIARVSLEGRIIEANRRFGEILEWPLEALMAVTAEDVAHPDDYAKSWDSTQALVRGEVPSFSLPMRYRTAAGRWVEVRLTVSPAFDPEGKLDHLVSVIAPLGEAEVASGGATGSGTGAAGTAPVLRDPS